jgi:hypothetical protein
MSAPGSDVKARIWALRFDYTGLVNQAAHYERAGMHKSAREAKKGAEVLKAAIVKLLEENNLTLKDTE